MEKVQVFKDGSYTDEVGNLFDKEGRLLAEAGSDADFDRYATEIQNGEGYYASDGKFVRYGFENDDSEEW